MLSQIEITYFDFKDVHKKLLGLVSGEARILKSRHIFCSTRHGDQELNVCFGWIRSAWNLISSVSLMRELHSACNEDGNWDRQDCTILKVGFTGNFFPKKVNTHLFSIATFKKVIFRRFGGKINIFSFVSFFSIFIQITHFSEGLARGRVGSMGEPKRFFVYMNGFSKGTCNTLRFVEVITDH